MAKLLYITANPKSVEDSYGLQVGEHFLKTYQHLHPEETIERVNLYNDEIPLIDKLVLDAWGRLAKGEELNDVEQAVISRMNQLVDQFVSADKYVFVTPLWNLGFPPMLKAYIDNVVIVRKTFNYSENGPIGLLANQGRKVLHIQGSGGVYSEGPGVAYEFTNKYLQGVLGFIGITDYQKVHVEGTSLFPDKQAILQKALKEAEHAANSFSYIAQGS